MVSCLNDIQNGKYSLIFRFFLLLKSKHTMFSIWFVIWPCTCFCLRGIQTFILDFMYPTLNNFFKNLFPCMFAVFWTETMCTFSVNISIIMKSLHVFRKASCPLLNKTVALIMRHSAEKASNKSTLGKKPQEILGGFLRRHDKRAQSEIKRHWAE